MTDTSHEADWIEQLSDEDRMFIKRFLLASGSLKELARIYKISYPTVRLRLDRLIARIKILDESRPEGQFEREARLLHAAGRFDLSTLKTLLTAHKKESEANNAFDHSPAD
jgi:hypothetical protein